MSSISISASVEQSKDDPQVIRSETIHSSIVRGFATNITLQDPETIGKAAALINAVRSIIIPKSMPDPHLTSVLVQSNINRFQVGWV